MSRESRRHGLAYFQTSPVRGQLEPYQQDSRPGWRYLQCTDTPNELKVLLPPRTSTLYSRLLQLEKDELAKGPGAGWEHILEIRHLKDRMIRKCHRISRFTVPPPSGSSVQFRIVNAPPDFRLKEMERWLRTNDASNRTTRDTLRRRPSTESSIAGTITPSPRSSRAAPSTTTRTQPVQRPSVRTSTSSKKRNSTSTQSTQSLAPTLPEKPAHYAPSYLSPVPEEGTLGTPTPIHEQNIIPSPLPPAPMEPSAIPAEHYQAVDPHYVRVEDPAYVPAAPSASHGSQSPTYHLPDPRIPLVDLYASTHQHPVDPYAHHTAADAAAPRSVISPEPIPHPYRPPSGYVLSREMYDEMHDAAMHPPAIGLHTPDNLGMPLPVTGMPEPSPLPPPPPPPPEEPVAHPHRPPPRVESVEDIEGGRLTRRRSGLRSNRSGALGAAKVVSWAMDRDWSEHMTKFDHIVYSAEVAGEELNRAHEQFKSEMQGVKSMRETISSSLERLRLETERLQLEERALKEHEDMMTASFEKLREREAMYKDKVKAVLEETKRVVVAADGKRDNQVLG